MIELGPSPNIRVDSGQAGDSVTVSSFNGDRAAMDEIAAFHLGVRQWQVATENNVFSNVLGSQADLTHIDDYYLRGDGNFFVARTAAADQLVGIVGFRDDGDGHGVLKRLAVGPEHHRQKIATRLVGALVEWAQDHSFSVVTLSTGPRENARYVYGQAGFREIGRVLRNRDYMMELDLTEQNN